jgi:hypothetical protein
MTGNCDTPGHEDHPGRLYPCGRRCEVCMPPPPSPGNTGNEPSPTRSEGQLQ